MNIRIKSFCTTGLIVWVGLVLVCSPALVWADADGDGIEPEFEAAGIYLHPGYDLWDASSRTWISPADQPDSVIKLTGLSDDKPDLFVIWYPGAYIDLQYCDLFALGTKPLSAGGLGFNIWVLKKNGGEVPDDRTFAENVDQKAVVLAESPELPADATGWSQYGTIMDESGGVALIYSQKIMNNIEEAANIDPQVQSSSGAAYCDGVDPNGNIVKPGENCLQCLHFQNTAIHEILHVMDTLRNDLSKVYSHHLTRGEYIMTPAIVYTEKKEKVTYYIPEQASSATQETRSFNPYIQN
jgi:hypothetical protein